MKTSLPSFDPTGVCLFGAAAVLLGLCGLLGTSRSKRARVHALAGLVAAAGLAAALLRQPASLWLPLVALGAVWGALALLRRPAVGRAVLATCLSVQAHSAALLILGPALVLWQVEEYDRSTTPEVADGFDGVPELVLETVEAQWAVTDTGRVLSLYTVSPGSRDDETARHDEERYLRGGTQDLHVIRTGEAGATTNCGGWVFTGGRFWLTGDQVETIIKDNGYRPVTAPQAGDVVVFRGAASGPYQPGAMVHTGVVRGIDSQGRALIESKWGCLGRFIHTPEHHPYPFTVATYYRTGRGGHLLRGLPGSGPDSEATGALAPRRASSAR
jgi:hypothetical protein